MPKKEVAATTREPDEEASDSTPTQLAEDGVTNVDNLCPFFGGLCLISSFYMLWPECFGVYGSLTSLCCECELKVCKISARKGDLCILLDLGCLLVEPLTCLKSVNNCCCVDFRCAIPCHDEMPCLLNLCGINCAYAGGCACHCCQRLGYMREIAEEKAGDRAREKEAREKEQDSHAKAKKKGKGGSKK